VDGEGEAVKYEKPEIILGGDGTNEVVVQVESGELAWDVRVILDADSDDLISEAHVEGAYDADDGWTFCDHEAPKALVAWMRDNKACRELLLSCHGEWARECARGAGEP